MSMGHPSSSMMAKVDLESLAMATQLRAKMPYGVLSGISIRNVSRSPIRTVSTSCWRESRIRILGAGASGAEVMLIMSGSRMGIIPKVMFLDVVSYVHRTL